MYLMDLTTVVIIILNFEIAALTNALRGMSKFEKMLDIWHAGAMFYTLSTWGLALVG